jgi:hypothetical protein
MRSTMATDPPRAPTPYKVGKVDTLEGTLGAGSLREWRFVPTNWVDPMAHHAWCVITDPMLISEWREKLKDAERVTWYRHGLAAYTAEISYDPVVRSVLVCIGGFV